MSVTETTTAPATVAAAIFEQLEDAWNRADGAAYGAPFAPDADFVDIRADHHQSQAAISAGHQGILDSIYAGSTVRYEVDLARSLAPGVVLAIVSATLDAPTGPLQGVNRSRVTAVLVEHDDRWVVAAFQNTLVPPSH